MVISIKIFLYNTNTSKTHFTLIYIISYIVFQSTLMLKMDWLNLNNYIKHIHISYCGSITCVWKHAYSCIVCMRKSIGRGQIMPSLYYYLINLLWYKRIIICNLQILSKHSLIVIVVRLNYVKARFENIRKTFYFYINTKICKRQHYTVTCIHT